MTAKEKLLFQTLSLCKQIIGVQLGKEECTSDMLGFDENDLAEIYDLICKVLEKTRNKKIKK